MDKQKNENLSQYIQQDRFGKGYIQIRTIPGQNTNAVVGLMDDGETVKIRINAPAEKGKANQRLIGFLAEELGISSKNIEIISGASSQNKLIRINFSDT